MSEGLVEWEIPLPGVVPLARLEPAAWNPRLIKSDRFLNLCRSIAADPAFLWNRPILAMEDGTIYAGNMRWRAVKYLWEKGTPANPSRPRDPVPLWPQVAAAANIQPGMVPAVIETVPDQVAKERALRDNGAWGEWQDEELSELVVELQGMGTDLSILGFDEEALNALLEMSGANGEELSDPGEVDIPAAPVTRQGDVWTLGRHRLMCGDASDVAQVSKLMQEKEARLVVLDPGTEVPYENLVMALTVTRDVVIRKDAAWFVWHEPVEGREIVLKALGSIGFTVGREIVWVRGSPTPGREEYHGQFSPCLFGWAVGSKRPVFLGDKAESNVWAVEHDGKEDSKPPELWARAIRNHTVTGDVVFDGFGGSGPILVAAEQNGRIACVMDNRPGQCDAMLMRWATMTKQDPVREDGMSYGDIKAQLVDMPTGELPADEVDLEDDE